MARVMEIQTVCGSEMMLRGKLGNQVFQVRNGKQIVLQKPRKRKTPPSEAELAKRKLFGEVQAVYNRLTEEELEQYAKAWKSSGRTYKGKKYCTLRGYIFAQNYEKYKK